MIHDVELKALQTNADERGHLTEIWRSDWDFFTGEDEPTMSYFSETHASLAKTHTSVV